MTNQKDLSKFKWKRQKRKTKKETILVLLLNVDVVRVQYKEKIKRDAKIIEWMYDKWLLLEWKRNFKWILSDCDIKILSLYVYVICKLYILLDFF